MAWNWLRKLLGIPELENRLMLIEAEKCSLEEKVISQQDARTLIVGAANQEILQEKANKYLLALEIPLPSLPSPETFAAIEATQIVEKYGFKRFVPPTEQEYPSAVISLKEFQEHPERYFHKLSKGCLGFPVGLNFEGVNKILEQFDNIHIESGNMYSNNGTLEFVLASICGYSLGSRQANSVLVQAAELADLRRSKAETWIHMDTLDFLANHNGLEQFVLERSELEQPEKERAVKALRLSRFTYLTALEIIANTHISDPMHLMECSGNERKESNELVSYTGTEPPEKLRQVLRSSLLTEPNGTSYREIQKLLPIRSRERFRQLASERTKEILSRDKEFKGLTNQINKPIKEYSVGESVVLACYFARNIISNYATLDDAVKRVLSGADSQTGISGKCTDYTGLALHYLKEYLVPLHSKKFENWVFGYDADQIGKYNHCYLKIIHLNPDEKIEVYFVDPTLLASKGIKALKIPEAILKVMDTSKFPLEIQRDAEDLMFKPIK